MRVILATAIATIILLAGCANTPFDPVEAPTWESGYAFTYDMSGSVTGSASFSAPGQEPETETIDESFGPVKAFSYEIISTLGPNNTYIAAFLEHNAMGMVPVASAVRHADLTFLQANVQSSTITAVASPAVDLAFPLTAGKTWGYSMPSMPAGAEDEFGGIGDLVVKAEATQATSVTIDNETLTVIEVVHRMSAPGLQEMLKQAEEELESQGFDASLSGTFSGKRVLLYAPALEAVVRETVTVSATVKMTMTYEGQSMQMNANTDTTFVMDLVGIDRMPEADRDMAQAAKFINQGQAIEAPGVIELPGEAFPLSINQSAVEVNAATAPTVTFTAEGNIPADANLTWTIFDAAGAKVATGMGETLDFVVDTPGAYGVQLTGRDGNGRLAATASSLLIGDYDGNVALTCGPVAAEVPGVSATQTCAPKAFTVPAGLQAFSLDLNAGATGPAPGTFRVMDGMTTVNKQTQNGMATVTDSDNLNPGAWTLQWRPTVGVTHSPVVHVVLDYGAAPAPAAPDAMETAFDLIKALEMPVQLPF